MRIQRNIVILFYLRPAHNICYDMFKKIFDQRIAEFSDEIVFDKDFIIEDKFSSLVEWLLVSIVKYIAGPNEILLAKLCRDI